MKVKVKKKIIINKKEIYVLSWLHFISPLYSERVYQVCFLFGWFCVYVGRLCVSIFVSGK